MTEVTKIAIKTPYLGSRSFKVIEFVTNGKGICDFLLVVNSNLGRISHGLLIGQKVATTVSFDALARDDPGDKPENGMDGSAQHCGAL